MKHSEGWMFILFGLFTMICSFKDFDFFMNNHKARFFVDLLGRDGTRVLYFVLGFFMLIAGLSLAR
ncbi:MAG: hypothetical protein CVV41_10575 [Candidatus Riflebacteria bacterium HGW-Riflebacteria-1]|jgi:ABC-type uncharacterized transport system fused permease/ATPase subunit|nr:MAG: hypothetical protein CVV41_10575 [Candidatus Riflebacteria bacterium HGW-Riflebacteria-1]